MKIKVNGALLKKSRLSFQPRAERTSVPYPRGSGMLVAAPFRPSEENKHVCPTHQLPAMVPMATKRVLRDPLLTPGKPWGPPVSAKIPPTPPPSQAPCSACERWRGIPFQKVLSLQTTPCTPVQQLLEGHTQDWQFQIQPPEKPERHLG